MKKVGLLLVLFLGACTATDQILSVADIARPTPEMLDSSIRVRGFVFFHSEEVMLRPENSYASTPFVELAIGSLFSTSPEFEHRKARRAEFAELIERFGGKEVVVHGILRVAPFGWLQRPMVYIDVERIEVANQSSEPTAPGGRGSP
jgi:hypothetical protein